MRATELGSSSQSVPLNGMCTYSIPAKRFLIGIRTYGSTYLQRGNVSSVSKLRPETLFPAGNIRKKRLRNIRKHSETFSYWETNKSSEHLQDTSLHSSARLLTLVLTAQPTHRCRKSAPSRMDTCVFVCFFVFPVGWRLLASNWLAACMWLCADLD